MKASQITCTTAAILLLGFAIPAFAGQERRSDDKNHPKQDNKQQAKPEEQRAQQPRPSTREAQPARQPQQTKETPERGQPQERQAPQQQQAKESPQRTQSQQRRAPQQQSPTVSRQQEHTVQQRTAAPARRSQAQQHVQQAGWQQHRAGNWQSEHRTWQQRGGYNGYRIPGARFRGYFGPEHGFRIEGLPFMVVGGYPRFQYDGYWLSVVDPWPADWDSDWYDNDQVYVAYVDNGYYLYNRSYPGVGIAVSISI
ncbi:MAG: hypothetical protein WCC27_14260 [Acidobacteriaceae bacterium]